jgi:hypothetical protein
MDTLKQKCMILRIMHIKEVHWAIGGNTSWHLLCNSGYWVVLLVCKKQQKKKN